eukprot:PhF_6_TR27202/c0_g1_i10/m.39993
MSRSNAVAPRRQTCFIVIFFVNICVISCDLICEKDNVHSMLELCESFSWIASNNSSCQSIHIRLNHFLSHDNDRNTTCTLTNVSRRPITIQCANDPLMVIRCKNITGCFVVPTNSSDINVAWQGCIYVGGPLLTAVNCNNCDFTLTDVVIDGERWLLTELEHSAIHLADYAQVYVSGEETNITIAGCVIRNASQAVALMYVGMAMFQDSMFEYVKGIGSFQTAAIDIRNSGSVYIRNMTMSNSSNSLLRGDMNGDYGGCLLVYAGVITIVQSRFTTCTSLGSGGALGLAVTQRAVIDTVIITGAESFNSGSLYLNLNRRDVIVDIRNVRFVNVKAKLAVGIFLHYKDSTQHSVVTMTNVFIDSLGGNGCLVISRGCLDCTAEHANILYLKNINMTNCRTVVGLKTVLENYFLRSARVLIYTGTNISIADKDLKSQKITGTKTRSFFERVDKTTKQPTTAFDDGTTSTLSQAMTTAGSLLVASSDLVMTTQMVHLSHCGRNNGDDSLRRPIISLGRVVPPTYPTSPKNGVIQLRVEEDAWEVVMLYMTSASLYALHLVVTVVWGQWKKNKNKTLRWYVRSVSRCVYPGSSIRYHMSVLLPMVSSCIAGMYVPHHDLVGMMVVGLLGYVVVLILFHVTSTLGGGGIPLRYVEVSAPSTASSSVIRSLFTAGGRWAPASSVSVGGPFFASYSGPRTSHPEGSETTSLFYLKESASPHGWIWVTICNGIVMSITSTVAEMNRDDDFYSYWRVCSVSAVCCGVVMMVCGIVHIVRTNTPLMTVRGMCMIRGVRLIVTGLAMCVVGVGGDDEGDNETAGVVLTYCTAVIGVIEILARLFTKMFKRRNSKTQNDSIF